tara:strand:+ start:153 stop:542 length:390 start_codon:yes stop_codon:yes gene_type:complete
MNYNINYKLTYDISNNSNTSDTNYRKDIIQVFNVSQFFDAEKIDDGLFFKTLSDNVNEIYLKYNENDQIKELLKKINDNLRLPFKLENDTLFMYLFRYDLFYLFHNCLKDLYNDNVISELNFQSLINSI